MTKLRPLFGSLAVLPLLFSACADIEDWLHRGGTGGRGGGGRGGTVDATPPPPPADAGVACTAVACFAEARFILRPHGGTLPAGQHEILAYPDDGPARRCTFSWPPPAGESGYNWVTCDPAQELRASVAPPRVCRPFGLSDGGSAGRTCEAVPGELAETIEVIGRPARVRLVQKVNGVTLLDRTWTDLVYEPVYLSGPACGPYCSQAHIDQAF